MEYMAQVKIGKEDFLALSDLAGEMSIMDYMSKVIHEHVTTQLRAGLMCPTCNVERQVLLRCSKCMALDAT